MFPVSNGVSLVFAIALMKRSRISIGSPRFSRCTHTSDAFSADASSKGKTFMYNWSVLMSSMLF